VDSAAAWIGLIGGAVGIIVALGGIAAYLGASKDKGTISTLEASNRALTERVAVLEAGAREASAKEAVQSARIDALERENSSLLSQRPSAEAIAKIDAALASHDTETRALLQAIVTNIQREGE
jgi:hypothetical protein